jgi:hypothetical protein
MEEKGHANLLTPVLYIITAMTILWLVNYDRQKGVFSSGLLFIFWLLVTLASIPDIIDDSVIFYQQVSYFVKSIFTSMWIIYLDQISISMDRIDSCVASFYFCTRLIYYSLFCRTS